MRSRLGLLLGFVVFAGAIAVPTAGAAKNSAHKSPLLKEAFGFCNGNGIGGQPQDGFAILKQNGNNTVSETVAVKNGPPNATYFVSLVQTPSGSGCNQFNPNVELTTNGQGNGNIHVNAPEVPGTTGAFAELFPANAAAFATGIILSQDVVF
jgi:hypothetical protein